MKKTILAVSILLLFILPLSVMAVEEHHPQTEKVGQAMVQEETENLETSVQKMQELREKIRMEKDPVVRNELMHQHMKMMREGMQMMPMMGGRMGMKGGKSMPMEDRMAMMEKRMGMMQKMMKQSCPMMGGGMMGGGMMGGGMMQGGPTLNTDQKLEMMEKRMMMMEEIMNGMMTQQEMMAR